jgi:hypothetical protein
MALLLSFYALAYRKLFGFEPLSAKNTMYA